MVFNREKYMKKWRKNHPNYDKNWKKNHPKYHNKYQPKYHKSDKGKITSRKACNKYYKTTKGKKTRAKTKAKRRNLGYNCINNWFDGSEGHHINKNDVIYIPKKLHRSTYHNVFTGKGMNEINNKAFFG